MTRARLAIVRALRRGRARQHHREAGVVDLRVVVLDGPDQRVASQDGRGPQSGAATEVTVVVRARQSRARRHEVVQCDAAAGVEALPHAVSQRVEKGDGLDEVGGQVVQEQPAFAQRLANEVEVQHLEVAKTAVDEFRGT